MINGHSQKDHTLVFKTNYRLMQVKSIAECSAILCFHLSLRYLFCLFLSGLFTQVSLYLQLKLLFDIFSGSNQNWTYLFRGIKCLPSLSCAVSMPCKACNFSKMTLALTLCQLEPNHLDFRQEMNVLTNRRRSACSSGAG